MHEPAKASLSSGAGATPPAKHHRDGVGRRSRLDSDSIQKSGGRGSKKGKDKKNRGSSQMSDESGAERRSNDELEDSRLARSNSKGGSLSKARGNVIVMEAGEQRTPRTPHTPRGNGKSSLSSSDENCPKERGGGGDPGKANGGQRTPRTPRLSSTPRGGDQPTNDKEKKRGGSKRGQQDPTELAALIKSDPVSVSPREYYDDDETDENSYTYDDEDEDAVLIAKGMPKTARRVQELSPGGNNIARTSSGSELRSSGGDHAVEGSGRRGGSGRKHQRQQQRSLGRAAGKESSAEVMLCGVREFIVGTDCVAEALMRSVKQADADWMAVELVNIFHAEKKAVKIRTLAISTAAEVFKNDPRDFLRNSSIYITILSEYTRLIGHKYLMSVIKPHVRLLTDVHMDFEIDPQRLRPDDDQEKNLQRLLAAAKTLLHQIFQSAQLIPFFLKQTIVSLKKLLVGVNEMQIIGTLLFLRFICPALVTPEQYHLLKEPPQRRRNLILVAKLLQNVANSYAESNELDTKEAYLQLCQPFIKESIPKFEIFAKQILDEGLASDLNQHKLTQNAEPQGLPAMKWMQSNRELIGSILEERHGELQRMVFEEFLQQYPPVTDDKDGPWHWQPDEKVWPKMKRVIDTSKWKRKIEEQKAQTWKSKNPFRKSIDMGMDKSVWARRLSQGLSAPNNQQDEEDDVEPVTLPTDKREWSNSQFFSHSSSDLKKKSNVVKKANRLSLNEDVAYRLNEVNTIALEHSVSEDLEKNGSIGKHSIRAFFSRPISKANNRLSKTFYKGGNEAGQPSLEELLLAEAERSSSGTLLTNHARRKSRSNSDDQTLAAEQTKNDSTPPTPRRRDDKISKSDSGGTEKVTPRKSLSNRFLMIRKSKEDRISSSPEPDSPELPPKSPKDDKKVKKEEKKEAKERKKEKATGGKGKGGGEAESDAEAKGQDGAGVERHGNIDKGKKQVKEKKGNISNSNSNNNGISGGVDENRDKLQRVPSREDDKVERKKGSDRRKPEQKESPRGGANEGQVAAGCGAVGAASGKVPNPEKDKESEKKEKRWSWGRNKKKGLDIIHSNNNNLAEESSEEGKGNNNKKGGKKEDCSSKEPPPKRHERKGSGIFGFRHHNDNKIGGGKGEDGKDKAKKKTKN